MLAILNVVANILAPIRPCESTLAMHLIVKPLALVGTPVGISIETLTFDNVLAELALVYAASRKRKQSIALPRSLKELSFVFGVVTLSLESLSMLLAPLP